MKKTFGTIAVYLNACDNWDDHQEYISKAAKLGFSEVFSSLHLPELSYQQQISHLARLVECTKQHNMVLTLDVGGDTLTNIFADHQKIVYFRDLHVDNLRLDCYYNSAQIKAIVEELDIHGFVLNTSVLNALELEDICELIYSIDDSANISSCHNFYIRPETGISEDYFVQQNLIFQAAKLAITACVPGRNNPRGPLGLGLPTMEKHRKIDLQLACLQLKYGYGIDRIMIGDGLASDSELQIVSDVINEIPINIGIEFFSCDNKVAKLMFDKIHHCRPDSGVIAYRLESSRDMAAQGALIIAGCCEKRERYDITIDNEKYKRYSGEIQIMIEPGSADERVNVIGRLLKTSIAFLLFINKGLKFRFEKVENNDNK